MLRTGFWMMALGVILFLVIAPEAESEGELLGTALTPSEMAAAEGQTCPGNCVYVDKVCGFGCVITWLGGAEGCTSTSNCYPIGWYSDQCAVGFTNRYLCDGLNEDPNCDNNFTSINCGGWSMCLGMTYACVGGTCTCTGVWGCGGVPYVTQCGSHASCQ